MDLKKFNRNIQRDKYQVEELINSGWHVLVVWECELKNDLSGVVNELEKLMLHILPVSTKKILIPDLDCFIETGKGQQVYYLFDFISIIPLKFTTYSEIKLISD